MNTSQSALTATESNVTQISSGAKAAHRLQKKTLIEVAVIARDLHVMHREAGRAREQFQVAVSVASPETQAALLEEMEKALQQVAAAIRAVAASLK